MTNTTSADVAAHPSYSTSNRSRSARITALAGLVSGAALVVDTVTITAINSNFGVLDDALFLVGFAGLWITTAALAVHLSAGRHGAARVGVGVAFFLGVALVLGGLSWVTDTMGRHVFSTANVGLHGEWSFFTIGVCLLAIAAWAHRRA